MLYQPKKYTKVDMGHRQDIGSNNIKTSRTVPRSETTTISPESETLNPVSLYSSRLEELAQRADEVSVDRYEEFRHSISYIERFQLL